MKILLAEDEEQLSRVLQTAMIHEGYEVDAAFDGQKAVDLALENAYDLMILDIMMPKKRTKQKFFSTLFRKSKEFLLGKFFFNLTFFY